MRSIVLNLLMEVQILNLSMGSNLLITSKMRKISTQSSPVDNSPPNIIPYSNMF